VLEGPLGLGLIVGEGFGQPLLLLFVRGGAIEGAQRVLDALDGADRIVGVEVRAAGPGAPDEQSGDAPGLVPAQDFEAPQGGALAQRAVVVAAPTPWPSPFRQAQGRLWSGRGHQKVGHRGPESGGAGCWMAG